MKYIRESFGKKLQRLPLSQRQLPNESIIEKQTNIDNPIKQKPKEMEIEEPYFEKKEQQNYQSQIVEFLATHSNPQDIDSNYFSKQTDITQHMRTILLNWIIDVHIKYRLQPQTLFITVFLIDVYLSNKKVMRTQLQLVGITSLWIAAKYQETYQVPKLSNLVYICDSTYTKEQIRAMEGEIISITGFDILRNTSLHYFNTVNRLIKFSEKDYYLGRYMLQICLFDISMQNYSPKIIACSIVFFINKLRRRELCWGNDLSQTLYLSQEILRPCARQICNLWQKAQICENMSSLKNKFLNPKFKQVAKIKLGIASKSSVSR